MGTARVTHLLLDGAVKAVVFDLDGTLYPSRPQIHDEIKRQTLSVAARLLHLEPAQARTLLRGYRVRYRSSVIGLERHHGVDGTQFLHEVYAEFDTRAIQPYADLAVEVERLAMRVRVCVLTNSSVSYGGRVLRQLGLSQVVGEVYGAESFGYLRKPHAAPFRGVAGALRMPARQLLMFDDSALNLERAHACGLATVLVSNGLAQPPWFFQLHRGHPVPAPSFIDGSCHDLVGFLRAINQPDRPRRSVV
ncbi:MAG: HAD-IA family hydrolase [Egibacteraceae bacterium]